MFIESSDLINSGRNVNNIGDVWINSFPDTIHPHQLLKSFIFNVAKYLPSNLRPT